MNKKPTIDTKNSETQLIKGQITMTKKLNLNADNNENLQSPSTAGFKKGDPKDKDNKSETISANSDMINDQINSMINLYRMDKVGGN